MRVALLIAVIGLAAPVAAQATGSDVESTGPEPESALAEVADAPPREAPAARIAVLVLGATDDDAAAADGVSEVLIGAIASRATGPLRIVGKEELQAALGHEESRSLECVSSPRCLGRLGVQLELDEVIAGVVRARDGGWRFDLNRVDGRSGQNVGRTSGEVEGDLGALAAALLEGLPSLYVAQVVPITLRVATSVRGARILVDGSLVGHFAGRPVEVTGLEPGPHTIAVEAEGHERWEREIELAAGSERDVDAGLTPIVVNVPPPPPEPRGLSSLIWVGAGVAALGGGMITAFGIRSRGQPAAGVTRAEAVAFHEDRQRDARIANVGLGVAGAGVGILVTGLLLSDFGGDDVPDDQVVVDARADGVQIGWRRAW